MMNKKNVCKWFLFLFMLLAFFISVYPLLWVVIQSLKTETEFLESIWTLPARLNFQNYATAWNDAGMSRYFMNSVVVTLVTTAVNLVFVTCAGYAFAKLTFPGKTFFYYMIIFNLLIPTAIILLPMFTMVNRMHLVNTLPALVFPYFQGFAPMGLIICRNYFEDLPDELMEAGKLDGCSNMQVFRKIMLPLAKPILATMAILSAMQVWNEYLWALTSITDESKYTLSVGVALFNKKTETVGYTPVFAALSISALVIVVVYLCMQKNFVKSIAAGAVKG
jgi:ABC-type glycerol-3-phosphate transport system permease component